MTVPPLLESLARALAVSPAEEAAELRAAVQRIIAGDADSLDAELGLKPGPGERHWRSVAALQRRDDLIRQIRADFFPGSDREAAAAISQRLKLFRNSGDWRRTKSMTTNPFTGIRGRYWEVLKILDREISAERVRTILRGS